MSNKAIIQSKSGIKINGLNCYHLELNSDYVNDLTIGDEVYTLNELYEERALFIITLFNIYSKKGFVSWKYRNRFDHDCFALGNKSFLLGIIINSDKDTFITFDIPILSIDKQTNFWDLCDFAETKDKPLNQSDRQKREFMNNNKGEYPILPDFKYNPLELFKELYELSNNIK